MSISVIIPTYNGSRFLSATLDSILDQSISDWEVVVVDDGSSDASAPIVREYQRLDKRIRLVQQENSGQSTARNRGYEETDPSSEFIIFLDHDDLWEKTTLETLRNALQMQPEVTAAYGLTRFIDGEGKFIRQGFLEAKQRNRYGIEAGRLIKWPLDRPTTFAVEVVMDASITAGDMLLRRSTLERSGLFDPKMGNNEDWDLWLRVCLVGPMAFVDRHVLRFRRHENNTSGNNLSVLESERYMRTKLLDSLRNEPALHRIALLGWRGSKLLTCKLQLQSARAALLQGHPIAALKRLRYAAKSYALFAGVGTLLMT